MNKSMDRVINIVVPPRNVRVQLAGAPPEQHATLASGEEQGAWRLPTIRIKPVIDFLLLGRRAGKAGWRDDTGCPADRKEERITLLT